MCLAIPAQIVSLDGDEAVFDIGGVRRAGNVALIDDAAVGDWVVLHTGVALSRIDAAAAQAMLQQLRDLAETA
jgi:hydrogenase expression/formation protein HypC